LYIDCTIVFAESESGHQYLLFGLLLSGENGKIFQVEQDRPFEHYWPGASSTIVAVHEEYY